ncbi:Uncharacterised protein [Serratia plymuthica]|nr:Uncharacterised protein [Serratia plymuthica]
MVIRHYRRRLRVQVTPGLQLQIAAAGEGAAGGATDDALVAVIFVGGIGVVGNQVNVATRLQAHPTAGGHFRAGDVDVATRLHAQPVFGADGGNIADFSARQGQGLAAQRTFGIPLAGLGFVDDAAVEAFQRHLPAAEGGTDIVDVADGGELQLARGVHQPAIDIADAALAGRAQPFAALQRTAVVDDATGVQINAVACNHAATERCQVFFGQVQLRCQHRLAIDRHLLPPDDAAVQLCHLLRRQADPELQIQAALRLGGIVYKLLHLLQIGADAVDITLAGLGQQGVADITGIERRIAKEAVVVVRIQFETIEEIGRTDKLRFVSEAAVILTRRSAGLLAQHGVQIVKQRSRPVGRDLCC